jgi:hypothetical protein
MLAFRAERHKLREQPARQEQLDLIWPAWNALPSDLLGESRMSILTGGITDEQRRHLDELRPKFTYLPLDKDEYYQALEEASAWTGLIRYVQSTFQLHKPLVESQLDYSTFDDVLTGRVAIYRTVKELEITHPGLLERTVPSLADIRHLRQRYGDYLRARRDAIALLSPLVFLPRLQTKDKLALDAQAVGLPHPPEKFPRHIYIARLAAFGKCSPERLAEFFAERFLNLSRHEMDEFCDEFHRPKEGRQGQYVFLAVWLADNAPLFNAFKQTWPQILGVARKYFNRHAPEGYRACPKSADNLKVFWKEHEDRLWPGQPRRIVPPTGRPHKGETRSIPTGLLTPLPFVLLARKG